MHFHSRSKQAACSWMIAATAWAGCRVVFGDALQNLYSGANLSNTPFATVGGNPLNGGYTGLFNPNGKIIIGQYEPGIPNSLAMGAGAGAFPAGNPFLPAANFSYLPTAAFAGNVATNGNDNHATEVAGVMVSSNPANPGIATGAGILAGQSNDITARGAGNFGSPNLLSLFQQTNIINNSAGSNEANAVNRALVGGGTIATINPLNNGSGVLTPFVDWGSEPAPGGGQTGYNEVYVVAGNEGPANITGLSAATINNNLNILGSPSDGYNVINVGATGVRNTAGANLNYSQLAPYNFQLTAYFSSSAPPAANMEDVNGNSIAQTLAAAAAAAGGPVSVPITIPYNETADGRIGVDIVAPGGDPFSLSAAYPGFTTVPANQGTLVNAPAANFPLNQFVSTAGGLQASTSNGNQSDTYAGFGTPASKDATTASAYLPTGAINGGSPVITGTTISGTSFAAPEVAGAAAIIEQYGRTMGFSQDQRVLNAIILNGASKVLRGDGTSWARAPQSRDLAGNLANVPAPLINGAPAAPPAWAPAAPAGMFPAQPGLDPDLGTGQLNLYNSLNNYAAGQHLPTSINNGAPGPGAPLDPPVGWDIETVNAGTAANTIVDSYRFVTGAGQFSATLDWDSAVSVTANGTGPGGVGGNWSPGNPTTPSSTFTRLAFQQLDLYLFSVNPNGTLAADIDYSTSPYDPVQYMYDSLTAGTYEIEIVDPVAITANTTYGLAWTVPEPTSLTLLLVPTVAMLRRRRRTA